MLNKVILIGRLGQEPKLTVTDNKLAICNFSLATSESWTKDGERQERTEWHRIVIFGKTAENAAKYLEKGSKVYVEGKIQSRKWEKDGTEHTSTEVVATNITFLDSKKSQDQNEFDRDQDVPF